MIVALLAEGGDRNNGYAYGGYEEYASPSSRRAGIEMISCMV